MDTHDAQTPPSLSVQEEIEGTVKLFICRIKSEFGLIPGKLLDESNFGKTGGSCYSTLNNQNLRVTPVDSGESDVLVLDSQQTVKWEKASGGKVPENAFVSGQLSNGTTITLSKLHSAPAPNNYQPANFPGGTNSSYPIAGSNECIHEFYGSMGPNYEVLVVQTSSW